VGHQGGVLALVWTPRLKERSVVEQAAALVRHPGTTGQQIHHRWARNDVGRCFGGEPAGGT